MNSKLIALIAAAGLSAAAMAQTTAPTGSQPLTQGAVTTGTPNNALPLNQPRSALNSNLNTPSNPSANLNNNLNNSNNLNSLNNNLNTNSTLNNNNLNNNSLNNNNPNNVNRNNSVNCVNGVNTAAGTIGTTGTTTATATGQARVDTAPNVACNNGQVRP
jgi:hypothetical protein